MTRLILLWFSVLMTIFEHQKAFLHSGITQICKVGTNNQTTDQKTFEKIEK